ncbi:hypothetical protein LUZ63_002279 [Rhynchospora breviuscula]|uniref:Glycosyltransferase 61 catalytic domain-containing protein n=1 Tax=Rhynchospora breviuscula TaxID=2022672 RepID=A0A9Q0CYZ2_9POAL|nr:hypothetical protein LUZ63_002279 [Rhynchospora breviuscula]
MNRRKRSLFVRTLLFLFALNSICIFYYFRLHPRPQHPLDDEEQNLNLNLTPPSLSSSSSLKPWPLLPSYLPWNISSFPPVGSCEAYFGNGFSRSISPLRGRNGFFRCHYSETLQSSICEGGTIRMDPGRIAMSRGGEDLEKVMGRREEDELPWFESEAFQIEEGEGWERREDRKLVDQAFLDQYLKHGAVHMHTMRSLVESIRVVPTGQLQCDQVIDEPTLLVTRFEYANMFHTVTDWYSAYVSSRVTGLAGLPHLVFIDGHCKAQLEETWKSLFTSVRYAKDFAGTVCFRHAILSPLGYETALFKGLTESFSCQGSAANILRQKPDYQKTARLSEFGEMLLSSFDLLPIPKREPGMLNILFVRREDYLAHPRHNGKVQSRLSNELEVFDSVQTWAKMKNNMKCKLNVVNGLFAHMHMKEQLQAIRDASIVIGAHGAGLTHLVSAQTDTIVLEIIASMYRRPHFQLISSWKGLEYHAINLPGSYARPTEVTDELSKIMKSLGC